MPANPTSLDQLLESYWAGKLDVSEGTVRRLIRVIETLKKKIADVNNENPNIKI